MEIQVQIYSVKRIFDHMGDSIYKSIKFSEGLSKIKKKKISPLATGVLAVAQMRILDTMRLCLSRDSCFRVHKGPYCSRKKWSKSNPGLLNAVGQYWCPSQRYHLIWAIHTFQYNSKKSKPPPIFSQSYVHEVPVFLFTPKLYLV